MTNADVVQGLEPAGCWRRFAELTEIARPSHHEEAAIAHVRTWASEHGFDVAQDDARNIVVRVPASAGRESAPTLVLQGHLDMVCERLPDSPNDPAEGRIELVRDGEWLTAAGTTLGADNGIGIAAMLALADDVAHPHGPLELLMTVIEEVGGVDQGATALDPALLDGRTLLNLDSEEDGTLTIGSASSTDTTTRVTQPRGPTGEGTASVAVSVEGGLGGHSGTDIARGRANAIKVLGRALRETLETVPFHLASLDGGKSFNAIPRDATAVCSLAGTREADFRAAVETAAVAIRDSYATTDPNLRLSLAAAQVQDDAWEDAATHRLLDLVAVLPSGPLAMSADFAGLVETSTSLGAVSTDGRTLTLHQLSRSSNPSATETIEGLDAAARLAGGTMTIDQEDAAWRPNVGSPILATCREVYEERFGHAPIVTAVHAWLETAVIGDRVPGLDMVSIGPQIEFPHSPDERVNIPSVERFWQLLVGVVDEFSRG